MKIILSRKGFDSSYGGVASPILPDGTLFSLPIPSPASPIVYDQLRVGDRPVGPMVEALTRGRVRARDAAHLDPDLRASVYSRLPGWRPLFGQDGAAQGHLHNYGVGPGDLFLFFGWFRQVERVETGYRFVRGAPDLHLLFGWLQIDQVLRVEECGSDVPPWAAYHPHFHLDSEGHNTVYVARDELCLDGRPRGIAGGGAFDRYGDDLRLTASGCSRSRWRLPGWFFPLDGRTPLTYHRRMSRWTASGEEVLLRSAPRGQEFVLDAGQYPEAIEWACDLISRAA